MNWITVLGAAGTFLGVVCGLYTVIRKAGLDAQKQRLDERTQESDKAIAFIQSYGQLFDDMQTRIKSLTQEVGRLNTQVQQNEVDRRQLQDRVLKLEEQRQTWVDERSSLLKRIAELETDLDTANRKIANLERELDAEKNR